MEERESEKGERKYGRKGELREEERKGEKGERK
jgi:hypothetical protein